MLSLLNNKINANLSTVNSIERENSSIYGVILVSKLGWLQLEVQWGCVFIHWGWFITLMRVPFLPVRVLAMRVLTNLMRVYCQWGCLLILWGCVFCKWGWSYELSCIYTVSSYIEGILADLWWGCLLIIYTLSQWVWVHVSMIQSSCFLQWKRFICNPDRKTFAMWKIARIGRETPKSVETRNPARA